MKKVVELKELRGKDNKSLFKELEILNAKLSDLKFKVTFRKLKNFREIRETRKKIARIWVVLGENAAKNISGGAK